MLDIGAEGPGYKSQSRRCRVLGKLLLTPIVPLFARLRSASSSHVLFGSVLSEAAAADVDPLPAAGRRPPRRLLPGVGGGRRGVGARVDEQVRVATAGARVARPTDDRRRRRVVRQTQLARRTAGAHYLHRPRHIKSHTHTPV